MTRGFRWYYSITFHQRQHEWSELPAHNGEEFNLMGQESESGEKIDVLLNLNLGGTEDLTK